MAKSEKPRGDTAEEGKSRRRALIDHAITAAVALLAVMATLLAAHLSSRHDLQKESRDRRSQVYADYLKAAATYRDRGYGAWKAVEARKEDPKISYNQIRPVLKIFDDARQTYRDQANQVAIYGSSKAWDAQKIISGSMLSSLEAVQVADLPGGPKFEDFNRGYKEFVVVFCEEAQAIDKEDCRPGRDVGATR